MARSAWQRLRELTRTYGQRTDRTGHTGDKPEGHTFQETEPAGNGAEAEDPHERQGSDGATLVGCAVMVAMFFFIPSCLMLVSQALDGELQLPWGVILTLALGLAIAICVAAVAWWIAGALQRRKAGITEESPHAGRTEDDQNSVGMP
ncbi:hypothetical protein ACF09K_01790 [Streptomyces sp. NPDC014882]|uniref:hypothetical protein n=1 Tax=Streptomyces sp. NPDC014882 TaxID=3364927 RepID=UPI0037035A2C